MAILTVADSNGENARKCVLMAIVLISSSHERSRSFFPLRLFGENLPAIDKYNYIIYIFTLVLLVYYVKN